MLVGGCWQSGKACLPPGARSENFNGIKSLSSVVSGRNHKLLTEKGVGTMVTR